MAEHLLIDGTPEEIKPLSEAISALETLLGENRGNHVIATIVALAHLDIAWAWRGTGATKDTAARNLEAFDLHCARARQVLDPFCGIELDSPLVTSTRCALLVGETAASDRVADDYEDLIDLAPSQQRHIRALGHHMLPQWFGSYQALELEARRTAARTQDPAGGFCSRLDPSRCPPRLGQFASCSDLGACAQGGPVDFVRLPARVAPLYLGPCNGRLRQPGT